MTLARSGDAAPSGAVGASFSRVLRKETHGGSRIDRFLDVAGCKLQTIGHGCTRQCDGTEYWNRTVVNATGRSMSSWTPSSCSTALATDASPSSSLPLPPCRCPTTLRPRRRSPIHRRRRRPHTRDGCGGPPSSSPRRLSFTSRPSSGRRPARAGSGRLPQRRSPARSKASSPATGSGPPGSSPHAPTPGRDPNYLGEIDPQSTMRLIETLGPLPLQHPGRRPLPHGRRYRPAP